MPKKFTTLYRHFDKDGRLLYVGITARGHKRSREHEAKDWWPLVHTTRNESFPTREDAHAAEILAIVNEAPLYNKQFNPAVTTVQELNCFCSGCGSEIEPGDVDSGYIEVSTFKALMSQRAYDEVLENPKSVGKLRVVSAKDLQAARIKHPRATWNGWHWRCGPQVVDTYWIDVDRVTTWEELLDWIVHLGRKDWIGSTNWDEVLQAIRTADGLIRRSIPRGRSNQTR